MKVEAIVIDLRFRYYTVTFLFPRHERISVKRKIISRDIVSQVIYSKVYTSFRSYCTSVLSVTKINTSY